MKVNYVLLISLLIVGALFVPAVSADEIYNRTFAEIADTTILSPDTGSVTSRNNAPGIYISDVNAITTKTTLRQVEADLYNGRIYGTAAALPTYHWHNVPLQIGGNTVGYADLGFFKFVDGETPKVRLYAWVHELDLSGYTGYQKVYFNLAGYEHSNFKVADGYAPSDSELKIRFCGTGNTVTQYRGWAILWDSWENTVIVENSTQYDIEFFSIDVIRNIDGKSNPSVCGLYTTLGYYLDTNYPNSGRNDIHFDHLQSNFFPMTVSIKNLLTETWYNDNIYLDPGEPGEPVTPTLTPTEEPTVMRTGTVTMTDHNGTTITGFDVTAINHYTDEEFTASTQSDVAVITLPMDRTIEIRNPQTGVYEEAPVGYYRFFGESPGYRMLHEDGIQVSVMPEKYGSYQLCDIRVTSESGYLTGKHQFQIRSRSDNSILQTGTISAKSATTDEWYNTSVTNGIASLILPYDTSNVISQYAGNYYVYATSPGYEDSDYGTQIVIMPHTVSEIHSIQLTPIGGIPPAGNVTLRIQVFSETGQGIPNAEIFIAGLLGEGSSLWDTYTASSTGYLAASVPGNSTYDIVASGAGYYDSARRVQVFDDDPALIEIKLYLSGAPTVEPTTQPTGWVTPPPTQTTSPIQEDNIIGLSVKGLAKGFGIDYDTALLVFGLMIIFGAGGMVMSSVKGGAMEFIAGSIVGTFVAFALGLIPIWIFIIIAVVFGAYVLRVFVQGGQ